MSRLTKESFLECVSEHEMTVILESEDHYHLRFGVPHTNNQYFDVITAPNRVIITGDMGDFIWQSDFLNFSPRRLLAGRSKEFSSEAVRNEIAERIDNFCSEISDWYDDYEGDEHSTLEQFEAAFREDVMDHFDSANLDEYRFVSAIEDFSSYIIPDCNLFGDFWCDFNADVPTYHYQWCVYAVYFAAVHASKLKAK